ncbi:MAG TPA: GyrI-like domain-containing protein [Cellvibrio sp.]|nr:GyrI-like domain-containing protein [Cellvibrio sp.]
MNDSNNTSPSSMEKFSAPRIEQAGPLLVAGLREQLDEQVATKIPQLWQQLVSCWDEIPQRVGPADYGLCIHLRGREYYYMAACAVWDFTGLPEKFSPFIIPSQTYAVFVHSGPVQRICETIDFAFDQWLPHSGYQHQAEQENTLHFFERYGEQFNPQTGAGDIEIWLPVTA